MEKEKNSEFRSERVAKLPDYIKSGIERLGADFGELFKSKQESKFLLGKMVQDEKVRTALVALTRTLLNIGISVIDLIPGIGEVVSIGADLAKLTKFDLTPDVSKGIAWGSEILELFTGGVLPTHAIETTFQVIKDIPRIKVGLKKAKEIWSAHQAVVKSKKVQDAAAVFAPAPMTA
jgi:hypothetical protein